MAEFVVKLADERGRVMEQVQTAATAEELRARFTHAVYHVFSVKSRGGLAVSRRKVKLAYQQMLANPGLKIETWGTPNAPSFELTEAWLVANGF